jgi:heptosyltransferase-2
MKILVVKHAALGDVIRTAYILPGLHAKYSPVQIYWLTAAGSVEALRFNPYITRILTFEGDEESLRQLTFDLVISLDDEENILHRLSAISCRKLVGAYLQQDCPTYTPDAAEWFDMGLLSRHGREVADRLKKDNSRAHHEILAAMLDIRIDRAEFYNSSVIEADVARNFDGNYFNIGLNSGAGGRWIGKQLHPDATIELIRILLRLEIDGKPVRVYLLGGKQEQERHAAITAAVAAPALFDAGTANSLLEFAAIIKQCDYLISSDSMSLHLAISQRVKNLSFYSPTSAAEIGTFGTGVKVVSLADDYCSYRRETDTSSLTALRLAGRFCDHLGLMMESR